MSARILLFAFFFIVSAYAEAQADTGPASDVSAIHHVIDEYAKAVDTVDLNLLSQIWSHSPEISFIYPLGEEHGVRCHRAACLSGSNGGNVYGTRS